MKNANHFWSKKMDDSTITFKKNENGTWSATGDAVRFHVVGETPADALRKAGDFLDEMESILIEKDRGQ